MWIISNSTNPTRQRENGMRKSERIRNLEIQVAVLAERVGVITETMLNLIEIRKLERKELESGKWYSKPKE
jgi:hypothetical protein